MNALNLSQLHATFDRLGGTGVVVQSLSRVLVAISVGGAREHFQLQQDPDGRPWARLAHPRPAGGDKVLQSTGRLKASVRGELKATTRQLILTASHPAANVHQSGGTIRPRLAKMLAIPLTREAARTGSPRDFRRPLHPLRGAKSILLAETPQAGRRKGQTVLQYALVREVKIPARPFLGFGEKTLESISTVVADRVSQWAASPFQARPFDLFSLQDFVDVA